MLTKLSALATLVAFCWGSEFDTTDVTPGTHWNYEKTDWAKEFPDEYPVCGMQRQSPINVPLGPPIVDPVSSYPATLPFRVSYHNCYMHPMSLYNDGHALVFMDAKGGQIISGGPLKGKYAFVQAHFHYAQVDSLGSEHLFDGKSAPLVAHLVHYNTKYPSVGDAVDKPDGLAVIGVRFYINEDAKALEQLPLASVRSYKQNLTVNYCLAELLPEHADTDFATYLGSLTTPPCYESVTWIIPRYSQMVSAATLAEFRKTQDSHGKVLNHNIRPVQPLNGRVVSYSLKTNGFAPDTNGAGVLGWAFAACLPLLFTLMTFVH